MSLIDMLSGTRATDKSSSLWPRFPCTAPGRAVWDPRLGVMAQLGHPEGETEAHHMWSMNKDKALSPTPTFKAKEREGCSLYTQPGTSWCPWHITKTGKDLPSEMKELVFILWSYFLRWLDVSESTTQYLSHQLMVQIQILVIQRFLDRLDLHMMPDGS